MKKTKQFTVGTFEAIAEKMRGLPAIERKDNTVSKAQGVAIMAKEIKELQKRGYTLEMIVDIIKEEGVTLSPGTLKSYLQRSKKKRTGKEVSGGSTKEAQKKRPVVENSDNGTFVVKPDSEDI